MDEIRSTPYALPGQFEWTEFDVENSEQMDEVYSLLVSSEFGLVWPFLFFFAWFSKLLFFYFLFFYSTNVSVCCIVLSFDVSLLFSLFLIFSHNHLNNAFRFCGWACFDEIIQAAHYVEDEDNMFRFDYPKSFLSWALTPPGWRRDW